MNDSNSIRTVLIITLFTFDHFVHFRFLQQPITHTRQPQIDPNLRAKGNKNDK